MHMLATLFFFAATINLVRAESPPKVISLATTDWCPYLCTNQSEKPGIVVEYYRFLEEQLGVLADDDRILQSTISGLETWARDLRAQVLPDNDEA